MDRLTFLQQQADIIKNSRENIAATKSLPEVYQLIDVTNDAVKNFYPNISCRNRCFLCCQHSNLPSATALEWEHLYVFIQNQNENYKKNLISKIKKLFEKYGAYLKKIHFALNHHDDNFKLQELYEYLPKFKGKSCVFLEKGSCTAYDGRPGKCRTQGFSMMQFGDTMQFQTCIPEIIRMEQVLARQGSRKVLMPVWNDYETRIHQLETSNEIIISVLPVWIYSHIENDSFIPQTNKTPDFDKILAAF